MRFYLIRCALPLHRLAFYLEVYRSEYYTKEYYKNSNTVGIRRSSKWEEKSKPQILSFGGKKCELDEKTLRERGDECLRKLDAGESEASVREWARRDI